MNDNVKKYHPRIVDKEMWNVKQIDPLKSID